MPLLKKNDGQDASKREGNTTHLCAFTIAAQSRSSNPVAVSVDVASSATDGPPAQMLLNHY
jgi:hypothetical protein